MKFRCERDVLAEALAAAGRAATGRTGTHPVLTGVRLDVHHDRLTVTGTDGDLTISAQEEVSAEEDGSAVLPARLAADVVRSLEPGRVDVEAHQDEVRIAAGRSEYQLRTLAVEDFPRITLPSLEGTTVDASLLGEALNQVVRAASSDEVRPVLTGVLLAAEADGLRLVATDSYRLAVRDLTGITVPVPDQRVLIPGRALRELQRLLPADGPVVVQLGERDAAFTVGTRRLVTQLIEGEFPNYRPLIPQAYPNRVTVGREALLDAIRRLKPLASARDAGPVRLSMSADGLTIEVSSKELGHAEEALDAKYARLSMSADGLTIEVSSKELGHAEEALDAKYEGSELLVAFNPDYLAQGVDAVAGDEVVIETLDAMKPAVIRSSERTDFLYLLMPVRVS